MLSAFSVFVVSWALPGLAAAEMSQTELRLQALEEKVKASEDNLRGYYKDGLKFETAGGDFKFQIGGRIMNDWTFNSADDDFKSQEQEPGDGVEFRRARLFFSGLIYDRVKFKAQYDFAGQDVDFKDVYMGLIRLPVVGNVNVGHFYEPFSLEVLTSSKYITFMERSLAAETFGPERNTGIAFYDDALDGRMTWAVGAFRPTDDGGDLVGSDDGYDVTFRLTGTPWNEDKGRKLLHLGFAYTYQEPDNGVVRFRSRPENHQTDRFIDTGNFSAEDTSIYGLEAALVLNSLSVQGEYMRADVRRPAGFSDPDFSGYYIEAAYYLTGENRSYKDGAFGRTKVKKNFLEGGGWGAWQVALRYSSVDLNDAGISGGEEDNITVGLNWHLNNHTRVMLNYVKADIENSFEEKNIAEGGLDMVMTRFQIDF